MRLFLLSILLLLPAFFAACELSILRLRPSRVDRLIEENQLGANSILRLQRRLKRTLMVTQLGITIGLVALGWLAKGLGGQFTSSSNQQNLVWDISIFFSVVTLGTLLSGLIPKALVLNRPEKLALQLSPVFEGVIKILAPFLSFLEQIASLLLKLIGLNTQWDSLVSALSAGELENLIESGRVTGLNPDEKNILEGVFALRDTQVREVMVPRSGMVTLPKNVLFSELMNKVHQTKHARFIVTGESLDDVLGILDLRLLAEPIAKGEMGAKTPLEQFIKPVPKIPESCTLDKLLPLIRGGNPLLLVVDEHGGTEGLITAADLTGEIVGDEMVEPNKKEPLLRKTNNNSKEWLAAGDIEIIELNKQLKIELQENSNHFTLAGYLLEKLQSVPSEGDDLEENGILFEIRSMNGPRISLVKIKLSENFPQGHLSR